MAISDLPYNYGTLRPAIESWHTQTYHTVMANSDLPCNYGTLRPAIQLWHTQTSHTIMAHPDVPIALSVNSVKGPFTDCVTSQYKAKCGTIGDRIAANGL